jgi:hypothetical protein
VARCSPTRHSPDCSGAGDENDETRGFEPLDLSAQPDVVPPAFASLKMVTATRCWPDIDCSNQLSYKPFGKAGLEPASHVVRPAFAVLLVPSFSLPRRRPGPSWEALMKTHSRCFLLFPNWARAYAGEEGSSGHGDEDRRDVGVLKLRSSGGI